jgi:hypothetical protein
MAKMTLKERTETYKVHEPKYYQRAVWYWVSVKFGWGPEWPGGWARVRFHGTYKNSQDQIDFIFNDGNRPYNIPPEQVQTAEVWYGQEDNTHSGRQ